MRHALVSPTDSLRSKYGVKTSAGGKLARTCDGILFASQRECQRYGELKLLEKAGAIRELQLQPAFELRVARNGHSGIFDRDRICLGKYVADFRYRKGPIGILVIEDVKGVKTALYRWKRKHVEAQYGITITET